jgi:hypothetical protein
VRWTGNSADARFMPGPLWVASRQAPGKGARIPWSGRECTRTAPSPGPPRHNYGTPNESSKHSWHLPLVCVPDEVRITPARPPRSHCIQRAVRGPERVRITYMLYVDAFEYTRGGIAGSFGNDARRSSPPAWQWLRCSSACQNRTRESMRGSRALRDRARRSAGLGAVLRRNGIPKAYPARPLHQTRGGGACLCSQESRPHAKIRPSSLSQRRQRGRMCRRSRRVGRETRRTRVPQDTPREIERLGAPLQCPETSDPRRSARPRERRCAASARRLGRAAIAADAARIRN